MKKLTQTSISIFITLFTAILPMSSTTWKPPDNIQEAEQNYTYSGPGSPMPKPRSNASNQQTLWVNQVGGEASWTINIPSTGNYSLLVRYSNDDTGVLDDVSVRVNGSVVGGFESEDTGGGGFGWNVFVFSPIISLGQLPAGTITLSLRLDAHDGFGIEYDKLTIFGNGGTVQKTYTYDAVGNRIAHSTNGNSPIATTNINQACPGDTVHIIVNDGTEPYTYLWSNGSTNDTIVTALAGIYVATVTDANGCTDTARVVVNPAPVANATSNSPVCGGSTLNLMENGGDGTSWSWSGPSGFTSLLQNPAISNFSIAQAGIYIVVVTNANGCTGVDSVLVEFEDCCPENLTINDNPITSDTYQANNSISSAGKVVQGSTVVFRAGNTILLNFNFEAELGGNFEIIIGGCVLPPIASTVPGGN